MFSPEDAAQVEVMSSGFIPERLKDSYEIVMACPGGCIGGGGTAKGPKWTQTLSQRQESVYAIDRKIKLHNSHDNPDVIRLYKEFLLKPNSELSHELLHSTYRNRKVEKPLKRFSELEKQLTLVGKVEK